MKKILMLGLITALCLSGCGSKPAESKEIEMESKTIESEAETTAAETVDITGRELFSITVGDETLDLTTCTLEELFKLLQKAGIDTRVPGRTMEAYEEDAIWLDDDNILLEYYNPTNQEKPRAESRISYLEVKDADEKCSRISLIGGKIRIGDETSDKYTTALDGYGIAYNPDYNSNSWIEATQVVNEYLQEGTITIDVGIDGTRVSFRRIKIPQVME